MMFSFIKLKAILVFIDAFVSPLLSFLISFSLQAYASGCDLVILDEDFSRIQIIPGVTHGYVQITCVDCCEDTGKVKFTVVNTICCT